MPPSDERFADLSPETRALLKTLSSEEVVNLKNMLRMYEGLVDRPDVLDWLKTVREEEIKLLEDGIRLVRSSQVVSRFMWWAIVTLISAAVLGSQVGDYVGRVFSWIARGSK